MCEYLSHRLISLNYYIYILRYLSIYHKSNTDEDKEAECSNKNTNIIIKMKNKHDFKNFNKWKDISDESFKKWNNIVND